MHVFLASLLLFTALGGLSAVVEEGERDGCPTYCHCSAKLTTVSCTGLESFLDAFSDLPRDTKNLSISGSNQVTFPEKAFDKLTNLRYLDLSNNRGIVLKENTSYDLSNIWEVTLKNNSFSDEEIDAFSFEVDVDHINLENNHLRNIPKTVIFTGYNVKHLNLALNNISSIPQDILVDFSSLNVFNLSHNTLYEFDLDLSNKNSTLKSYSIKILDLSKNNIKSLGNFGFQGMNQLKELYLNGNMLIYLDPNWFFDLKELKHLSLSNNPVVTIPSGVLSQCSNLQWLRLDFMDSLLYVDSEAFIGLGNLSYLDLSNNRNLKYLHALTFENQTSLQTLNLSHSALESLDFSIFEPLIHLQSLDLAGNPWHCNCDSHWFGIEITNSSLNRENEPVFKSKDFICASPPELKGLELMNILHTHNFSCFGAKIVNHTIIPYHAIGTGAVIDCVTYGDPIPEITWITPRQEVLHYIPTHVHPGRPGPQDAIFHQSHSWHNSSEYQETFQNDKRIHVLLNGSLYIDYVLRKDAGPYTCLAHNSYGNHSVTIHFRLNFLVIKKTMVKSVIIGFILAAGFFVLGLISGLIRYLAFKCSSEQRQKRKSIREILEGLETFRSDKMDKLSAYKTAKIDQLSAFKTAKVDKLRGYKNLTVTPLLQYLHKSREYYASQSKKIGDNCAQQVEKLRENYNMQRTKFKGYRSNQIDKIKENYNCQLLKIRQCGSNQMERLREQYKFQQQHILKLLELLDIGNCMTVIEAECIRTESMIFNSDLTFDLEAAVYLPRDDSQSEYMTAGDTTDNSSEHSQSRLNLKDEGDYIALDQLQKKKDKINLDGTKSEPQQRDIEKLEEDLSRTKIHEAGVSGISTNSSKPASSSSVVKDSSSKHRATRKKHRQKPERCDPVDEDDDDVEIVRPYKRRGPSKDRKDKKEQKKTPQKDSIIQLPDYSGRRERRIASPEEINRTLQEIVIDIDKLKRTPLTLSLPEINLDLSYNISTDDEQTPKQCASSLDEGDYDMSINAQPVDTIISTDAICHVEYTGGDDYKRHKKTDSNQTGTSIQSTDYESAQEPDSSRNTTPSLKQDNTGSPNSFASFPSTPSTPTLTAEGHQGII